MKVFENKRICIDDMGDTYTLKLIASGVSVEFSKDTKICNNLIDYAESGGRFDKDSKTTIRLWIDGKHCGLAKFIYASYHNLQVSELPKGRICFVDGDNTNCRIDNLYCSGLPTLVTRNRAFENDDKRIYIKHRKCPDRFFTYFEPELLELLLSPCFPWVCRKEKRKKGSAKYILETTIMLEAEKQFNRMTVNLSGVVWAYYNLGMRSDNVMEKMQELRATVFDKGYVIDHLRDNSRNNCPHNLSKMTVVENSIKNNRTTQIQIPYIFVPVYVNGEYRVICGKVGTGTGDWHKFYKCGNPEMYNKMLGEFLTHAKKAGDMLPLITDGIYTNNLSRMLTDDGYSELENFLSLPSDTFVLYHDGVIAECFNQQANA